MITTLTNKVTKSFSKRCILLKDHNSLYMSRIISLSRDTKDNLEYIDYAVRLLREGQIIALPTDTVYGIAADAQNTSAIRKLYEVKNRAISKPLAICVGEPEDAVKWCQIDSNFSQYLLPALLPGPVTLVFKRNSHLNSYLNPGISRVGIRVPDHPFIRAVARKVCSPIALTSANISSEKASITTEEFSGMWSRLNAVFDGGPLGEERSNTARLGSTVVDLSIPGFFHIIRSGSAKQKTVAILKEHGLFEQ